MTLIVSVGTNALLPQNEQLSADSLCTYIVFKTFRIDSFRSVVVITCALHAQGPRFEPGRKQIFFQYQQVFLGLGKIEETNTRKLWQIGQNLLR